MFMSSADLKPVARDFYVSYNDKDLESSFDRFIATNLINHTMGGSLDREKWLNFDKAFLIACPDLKMIINEQVAEGDQVVTHWDCHGTHTADFLGFAPWGNPIRLTGISIDRIENGKIAEHFALADFTQFMKQFEK
jgi:predicted ester cyclase